ncbi:hypothetical protein [Pseudoalteromonas sp. C12FD-1]|uniref:hypothetical protein n=1 Tax=Pseudoalteromonas sp. C12FD-1 TaxID=3131979 RepID=UPI00307E49D5
MSQCNKNEFSKFDTLQALLISEHGFRNMQHLAAYTDNGENNKKLSELLKIDIDSLEAIVSSYKLKQQVLFSATKAESYSLGLCKKSNESIQDQRPITYWPDTSSCPPKADVKNDTLAFGVEDQKIYPTCEAMAHGVTAQVISGNEVKFSKKFYNKLIHHEMGSSEAGSCAYYALKAIKNWGICPDSLMPYEPWEEHDDDHQVLPSEFILQSAKKYKFNLGYYSHEPSLALPIIKSLISGHVELSPRPIPIGLPLYSSFNNAYTRTYGEVNCPLPDEKLIGYHAMTAVGYCQDDSYPGGGYIIVLNSWGEEWANQSEEGPGICRIPYRYIEEYVEEVSVMLLMSESLPFSIQRADIDDKMPLVALNPSSSNTTNKNVINIGKSRTGEDIYWSSDIVPNQHMLFAGSSGETKSNTLKHWVVQQKTAQCTDNNIIFDMHGEYPAFCSAIADNNYKSQFIDIAEVGFPFQVLRAVEGQPLDLQRESILDSIKSSAPQMGNIQISLIRDIIGQGLAEQWSNLELRKKLEKIEDHNTKSQIYPFILLLRSDGQDIETYLSNNLTVFDLSAYQDPRSRAAFVIFTTAQLFHHQRQQFYRFGKDNFNSIRIWIEEATTVKEAKQLLSVLFEQARKFKLFGTYITQVLSDIPTYISRNCATKVFFRSAVKDHNELKNKILPDKIGEAIIQIGEQEHLVQIPHCEIDNLAKAESKLYAAACKPVIKNTNPIENTYGIDFVKAKYAQHYINTLSQPFSWFAKSKQQQHNLEWKLCYKFSLDENHLIMDAQTGAIVMQLEPYKLLPCWQSLLLNLSHFIDTSELKTMPKSKALSLCETGLFGFTDNGIGIAPFLKDMPTILLPDLNSQRPDAAPEFSANLLNHSHLREFRAVVSALWKITLPTVIEPVYIPIKNNS